MLVAHRLDVILRGFACKIQRSRQSAFGGETAFNGLFHGRPDIFQMVDESVIFLIIKHILPISLALLFARLHNVGHRCQRIDVGDDRRFAFFFEGTAANAVDRPFFENFFRFVKSLECHAVRMIWQKYLWLPDDIHWRVRL